MFTDRQLRKLIFPLVIEQLLSVLIGTMDSVMVASCGEAAVSGISLVDTISVLMIGLLGAMATGGSVTVAQFIGRKDMEKVGRASNQLFLSIVALALVFAAVVLIANRQILGLIYGGVEADVMQNAVIYFYVSALSYPFLAVYNGGAALFRAVGDSKVSMKCSLVSNVVNVIGNAILIYGFSMGVLGAGLSTLFARMLSAGAICLILKRSGEIPVKKALKLDWPVMRSILYIGVPNGLETSIFQLGKILVSSLVAGLGTSAITANSVASTVGNFQLIASGALGMSIMTVVGQCVGAGEYEQAKGYLFRLIRLSYLFCAVIGTFLLLFGSQIIGLYQLSDETFRLTVQLLRYHCVCSMLVYPLSFNLPNGLRAAGDVRYTMAVSIGSMWICRIGLAYALTGALSMGIFGVWIAMTVDWLFRSIFFTGRVLSGGWLKHAKALVGER